MLVIKDTSTQPLNCLLEHLEEEELKVKHWSFLRLTSLIHLCCMRQALTPIFDIGQQVQFSSPYEGPTTTPSGGCSFRLSQTSTFKNFQNQT